MKKFSSLSFRSRLLALILVFALLPVLVIVVVLYFTQSRTAFEKNHYYQTANNIMFSEIFDSYYYRMMVSDLEVLKGRREKLKLISQAIMNVHLTTENNPSAFNGTASIIRNIMFESTKVTGLLHFVYDKINPENSYYVRADYRRLLKYKTMLGDDLETFLTKRSFNSDGTYHVLTDPKSDEVYLLNVTDIDEQHMLCIAEKQNDLRADYLDVRNQIIEALNNVMNPEGRKLSSNKNLLTFVFDINGVQVAPSIVDGDRQPMYLEQSIRDKVLSLYQKTPNFSYEMTFNGIDYQMLISFYNQMDLFIVSATPINDILKAQRQETTKFLLIALIVGVLAIILVLILVYDLVKPLTEVTINTRNISKLDLRDISSVRRFINNFDKTRKDEVGEISTAISKMTTNLSSNICNLLETQDRQRKIEGELNAAKDIQLGFLPENLDNPALLPLKVNGQMHPAKEVGGDLYDVIALDDDNVALIIGDVSDKGVPAALFMAMTVTIIAESFSLKMNPARVMSEVNKNLCRNNPNMMFVTLFVSVLNKRTGEFTYANGGHCQPVLCRNHSVSVLDGLSGPAPGVVPDFEYREFKCSIEKDTRIFLYTDGVSEAQNEAKALFGEERIYQCVERLSDLDVNACAESMLKEIITYRGKAPQSDDITMLIADF